MDKELSSEVLQAIRSKIMAMLKEKRMTILELATASGISETGFHSRFREGSLQVRTLVDMAQALGEPVGQLLPDSQRGEVVKRSAGDRPYVEDRLEQVEREVRSLRNELRKR